MLKRALVLLTLAVLSGCAVVPDGPTLSPSPSGVPATALPLATPSAARPPQVFGGSCDSFVTAAEISQLYGSPLVPVPASRATMTASFLVDEVGGLRCIWTAKDDPYQSVWISAALVPIPAVEAAESSECYEDYACFVDATAGGIRLSFVAEGADSDAEFAGSLVALFRERAVGPAPTASTPAPGAWLTLTDCSVLSNAFDVGAYFDQPGEWVQEVQGRDYDGTPSAMVELWTVPINTCDWANYEDEPVYGFRIDTLGGGAWVYDELVQNPGEVEVTVEGFEHTLVEETESGWPVIHFFDGTNWMRTEVTINGEWPTDPELIGRIARAAADVLDLTAAR